MNTNVKPIILKAIKTMRYGKTLLIDIHDVERILSTFFVDQRPKLTFSILDLDSNTVVNKKKFWRGKYDKVVPLSTIEHIQTELCNEVIVYRVCNVKKLCYCLWYNVDVRYHTRYLLEMCPLK